MISVVAAVVDYLNRGGNKECFHFKAGKGFSDWYSTFGVWEAGEVSRTTCCWDHCTPTACNGSSFTAT